MAELVSVQAPNRLFGRVQTPTHLFTPATITSPTDSFRYALALEWARLHNRSGGAAAVGLGVHLPDALWVAGQWTDATSTYTEDTTDAQDAGADDVPLSTLTNNDGHVIAAEVPFNAVSYDVTTAEAGSAGTYAVDYWDGSAWTAMSNLFSLPTFTPAAEHVLVFGLPADWAKGGSGTGMPTSKYAVRVRATTAPGTTAAVAQRLHLARLCLLAEAVADNGELRFEPGYPAARLPLLDQGDGVCAFFSTANGGNFIEALVSIR